MKRICLYLLGLCASICGANGTKDYALATFAGPVEGHVKVYGHVVSER